MVVTMVCLWLRQCDVCGCDNVVFVVVTIVSGVCGCDNCFRCLWL